VENIRLTADVVLLARPRHVLLIQRGWEPFKGRWALPGGRVDNGEPTIMTVRRELFEETGLTVASLDLVGVYADPGRDPRGRYVTFAYGSTIGGIPPVPVASDDAVDARWWPIDELTAQTLAFDHNLIIADALVVFPWAMVG
jgi:8-oxo-dGTP diphosphatase